VLSGLGPLIQSCQQDSVQPCHVTSDVGNPCETEGSAPGVGPCWFPSPNKDVLGCWYRVLELKGLQATVQEVFSFAAMSCAQFKYTKVSQRWPCCPGPVCVQPRPSWLERSWDLRRPEWAPGLAPHAPAEGQRCGSQRETDHEAADLAGHQSA